MNRGAAPRIFLSAGEPSGDLHGSRIVSALRERLPAATLEAFGGSRMAAAGARVKYPMEAMSAFGFVEILGKIPAHLRLLRTLRREFEAGRYDLVLLIDYPGFHLRVAEAARRAGIPVLYYIAPQLWAWHPGRAARFARAVSRMAVILPFEERFFASVGIRADFVGHPLAERIWPSKSEARSQLGVGAGERILGIFPGSRTQEVRQHWPLFRTVAQRMLEERRCDQAIVAGTASDRYPDPGRIEIRRDDPVALFATADAVLAKSGTTTLEAAFADTPMVVAYLTNVWTYLLARRLMTVPAISLVNLVAEREVVPEFWKRPVTPAGLAEALRPLLDPASPESKAQHLGLAEVRRKLGTPGAAARVAGMVEELLPG